MSYSQLWEFCKEKPMRQFGHQDPVDKHHASVEIRWLKQLRRQLKRAMQPSGDDWVRTSRVARAAMIKRKMGKLAVEIDLF
jgi:hypothetical protein